MEGLPGSGVIMIHTCEVVMHWTTRAEVEQRLITDLSGKLLSKWGGSLVQQPTQLAIQN